MQLKRRRTYERLSQQELQRRLAEELAALEETGDTDRAQLLHELAVHQIEIELQNRQLQDSMAEAEQARNRYADLFDDAPVGYAIVDRKGRMHDLNLRSAHMLGREVSELRGRHLGALLEAEDNPVLVRHLKTVYAGSDTPVVDEVQARTPRGSIRLRLESVLGRAERGSNARCRMSLVDITAQRRAEDELQEHRQALVHAARMSLLGEVGSALAHELSQPLGALSLYMSVARRRLQSDTLDEDSLSELLQKSERQIHRVSAVLRRIRRFIRMRPRHSGCYDLATLVGRVLSYLEPDVRRSGVRVRLTTGGIGSVAGDQYQLEQVFIYLLRNAIESIEEAGVTDGKIEIAMAQHNWGVVEVSIADNGGGLPDSDAQIEALFEPLRSRRPGAIGLGLSLSRSIVEDHGGRLWAEPNSPHGARFVFTLPLRGAE